MPSQINRDPWVARIGRLPFLPTIFNFAVTADAPAADVRPVPIAIHCPFLKTSNFNVLPAFEIPVSTTICTDEELEFTRVASHVREPGVVTVCESVAALVKLKHAESVKFEAPAELNALIEKQYERFGLRFPKSIVGLFAAVR